MIAKVQTIFYENTEKIDEICKILFNYENRIEILENKVDKIEIILKKHEEAILNLTDDISNMKEQMVLVLNKIKNLEIRVENLEKNKIQNDLEKILDYIIKMNEEGLKELARFILDLRKNNMPFGLEHIMKGIKIIVEKNKEI